MDLYKRALKRIEQDKQCRPTGCCFGPTGATGPTGPQGPATISVGTTTTTAPGTQASVTNVGTPENTILQFDIFKAVSQIETALKNLFFCD